MKPSRAIPPVVAVFVAGCQPPRGPRGFAREVLLETTSETSTNAAIGDLDGDGDLDIVLAKGRYWPLVDRVLLNDGRGHFPAAEDLGKVADRSYSS